MDQNTRIPQPCALGIIMQVYRRSRIDGPGGEGSATSEATGKPG